MAVPSDAAFLPFGLSQHKVFDFASVFDDVARHDRIFDQDGVKALLNEEFIEHLTRKGWCIIKLPNVLLKCRELIEPVTQFFDLPTEEKAKYKGVDYPFIGYNSIDHKEGIRWLTNTYRWPLGLPKPLAEKCQAFAWPVDSFQVSLMAELAEHVFQMSHQRLGVFADMPVAFGEQCAMVDIAHYYNEKAGMEPPAMGKDIDDVNCIPHYDPGMFSVSCFSTAEGLQMFDPKEEKWYAAPSDLNEEHRGLGVFWLGEAAAHVSKGKFKAGVHRVVYPKKDGSRLTMWFEACTVAQINGPEDTPLTDGRVTAPHLVGPGASFNVKKGDTKKTALAKLERRRGIPMSKSALIDDMFQGVEDLGLPNSEPREVTESKRSGCILL